MNGPKRQFGFTLVELLVVIAIIVLLVAIMFPAFRDIGARAQSFQCKSNLHKLAQILQLEEGAMPDSGSWVRFARDHEGQPLLACPSSTGDEEEGGGDLTETFIVQNFTLFTNIQDALDTGGSPVDQQVKVNPPGIVGDHGWDPPEPGANQDLITMDDDAAIMITHSSPITIESLDPPGDGPLCGSEHWVVQGDGSPEWLAEIEAHMRGTMSTTNAS